MKSISSIVVLLAALALPAQAITVADVDVPETTEIREQSLNLYGAGIRKKFFMKLYVGSLYASETGMSADGILAGDKLTAVRLNIISGLITSDKMISTIEEGFEKASGGNMAPLRERLNNFMAVFSEAIVEGDQFTMVSIPGVGLEAYKNGKLLTLVEGDDFRRTLFSIWLGEEPADDDLKDAMLGN